jgi:aspartyl-tRNA(Asn)/glutamyl-tRNA(Gln) amidotransferase subunit B
MKYETVIGLEIHAQLLTDSKMFCGCSTKFGAEENANICPVCTGQPGVLPVINKKAIELAMKTAIALGCKISPKSIFARKNYFYPDLPKNYQISQYDMPLAVGGHLDIYVSGTKKKIGITRVHLEEDAGKLVHQGAEGIAGALYSLVDFNRTGVPLMEIVSEPDIRSPEEAKTFMEHLAHLLQYIGVCDAKMEEGSLRCDANISLRKVGNKEFGVKTEIKNMNSFKAVYKALEVEVKRQTRLLEEGAKIVQETRLYDDVADETRSMRSKEFAHDYRYFPDPDLLPLEVDEGTIEKIKASIGELPDEKTKRFVEQYKLSGKEAEFLISSRAFDEFFEEAVKIYDKPKVISNWLAGEISFYLNSKNLTIEKLSLTPSQLVEMLKLIDKGTISGKIAKELIIKTIETGKNVHDLVSELGMTQISDESEVIKFVKEALKKNPKVVDEYKKGKKSAITFLIGQVMKESRGRANPKGVSEILRKELENG